MEKFDCVLIFNSIHRVMKAEALLKAKSLKFRLIPVPRSLASDCGLAMEMFGPGLDEFKKVLSAGGIEIAEAHLLKNNCYVKIEP